MSVRRMNEGVEGLWSELKVGRQDLVCDECLNKEEFTRREGRSRRGLEGPCNQA